MEVEQIKGLGRELKKFLAEFGDCFGWSEPRGHLRAYVQGQLSDLPHKSIEPMALAAQVTPRTLQSFVSYLRWDEQRLRDRTQWIVARDHAHPRAIGDHRRERQPQEGPAHRRGPTAMVRQHGQAGQLRGGGSSGLCRGRLPVPAG